MKIVVHTVEPPPPPINDMQISQMLSQQARRRMEVANKAHYSGERIPEINVCRPALISIKS